MMYPKHPGDPEEHRKLAARTLELARQLAKAKALLKEVAGRGIPHVGPYDSRLHEPTTPWCAFNIAGNDDTKCTCGQSELIAQIEKFIE